MYVKDRRLDSGVKYEDRRLDSGVIYEDPLVQSFENMYISHTWLILIPKDWTLFVQKLVFIQ